MKNTTTEQKSIENTTTEQKSIKKRLFFQRITILATFAKFFWHYFLWYVLKCLIAH